MCNRTKLKHDKEDVQFALKASFKDPSLYKPQAEINGFDNPLYPVVTNVERGAIVFYEWGLIADYLGYGSVSDKDIKTARDGCLNAKGEELTQKRSFREKVGNRCLVPMDGMYEWQWSDLSRKNCKKTKYLISKPDDSIFLCGGLYNDWTDPRTGVVTPTFTICTTEGNELMKVIHNSGERMPIVLNPEEHEAWLDPAVPISEFLDRSRVMLIAIPVGPVYPVQGTLF